MKYCQDCGASNAKGAKACRTCGHAIQNQMNGEACWSCQTATAIEAAFCSSCGAALAGADVDILVGESLPRARAQGPAPAPVVADDGGSDIALSEGMDLPDWLKRAAAEQPFDPTQQSMIASNPFAVNATPGAGGMMAAAGTATLEAEPVARPAAGGPPPPAFPTAPAPSYAGSPANAADAAQQMMARAESGAAAARAASAAAPGEDLTNTASFISENDLPEWIRQIGAAEEAKRVEDARAAAEQASAAAGVSGQSRPLPGEIAAGSPAASPWLARREAPADRDVVAADSWSRSTPPPAAVEAPEPVAVAATAVAPPVIAETIIPFSVAEAEAATGPGGRARMLMIAAVLLAVIAAALVFFVL